MKWEQRSHAHTGAQTSSEARVAVRGRILFPVKLQQCFLD